MLDFLEDAWDSLVEGFWYILSFEWWGDFTEAIGSAFEDIGELSIFGIAFAVIGVGMIFMLREQMLNPFLKFYSPAGRILWGGVTYVGTGIAGYFMGKYFENS
jgi:uncharacterized protein YjeT (DUF2065 family)